MAAISLLNRLFGNPKSGMPTEGALDSAQEMPDEVANEAVSSPMDQVNDGDAKSGGVDLEDVDSLLTQPVEELSENEGSPDMTLLDAEKAPENEENEQQGQGGNNLLSNLFEQEMEEEDLLRNTLIASLTEISLREILDAGEEVKAMIQEWQQKIDKKGAP